MNARELRTLYVHEIRGALRERNIVVYSLLIPAILYPLLIWLLWTGTTFVLGQNEDRTSRVALVGAPAARDELRRELEGAPRLELLDLPDGAGGAADAVRAGRVDAALELETVEGAGPPDLFRARLTYDGSSDRSEMARGRLTAAMDKYRTRRLSREASARGIDEVAWSVVRVTGHNAATGWEMGAFLLKLMVPMLLLVMVSIGCFYPAVDSTAGERERSTWETLMTVSASRSTIITAKYLYVATMGCATGLLNLAAMLVSIRSIVASALGDRASRVSLEIPLAAAPVMVSSAALIALFVAAVMMILASLARTFKEGQSMVSPFCMVIVAPALLLQSSDLELTPSIAMVPLLNVTVMFRDALSGTFRWPLIGLTAVVQVLAIALCLMLAGWMARFEDVFTGSFGGGLGKLLRERLFRR